MTDGPVAGDGSRGGASYPPGVGGGEPRGSMRRVCAHSGTRALVPGGQVEAADSGERLVDGRRGGACGE